MIFSFKYFWAICDEIVLECSSFLQTNKMDRKREHWTNFQQFHVAYNKLAQRLNPLEFFRCMIERINNCNLSICSQYLETFRSNLAFFFSHMITAASFRPTATRLLHSSLQVKPLGCVLLIRAVNIPTADMPKSSNKFRHNLCWWRYIHRKWRYCRYLFSFF